MKNYLLGLLVVITALGGAGKKVYAEMLITPTQLVFEGRERFAHVTLVNVGDKPHSYVMDFVYMKMSEGSGTYAKLDSAVTEFDLAKHVMFSPKRVRLAPGAKQRVRLAIRRPEAIPDGDYHVHLRFKSEPQDSNDDSELPKNTATASVSFNISYTIPVVLRQGDVVVSSAIEDMSLSRSKDTGMLEAKITVTRDDSTPYSVLGYLRVYNIDENGNEILVGEISNANIFPEISSRSFGVPFTSDVKSGSLRVVLSHYDRSKNIIYAERVFPIE